MYFATLCIPTLITLLATGTTILLCNIPFGKAIPLTFLGIILTTFISGIAFHSFYPSYTLIVLYALSFLFYTTILIYEKRGIKLSFLRKRYVTTGFYSFIILYLVIAIITWHHGADLAYWDEYAHWGQMTKELLRLNYFYITSNTTLAFHNDYPPAISLLEATWCWFAGKYDERIVYAALQLFQIGFLIFPIDTVLHSYKQKFKIFYSIILAIIIFIFSLYDFVSDNSTSCFYQSIYIDTILSILSGFSIYYAIFIYQVTLKHAVYLIGLLSTLLLTKQLGLFFFLLILLLIVVKIIIELQIPHKFTCKKNTILSLGYITLIPSLFLFVWNLTYSNSPTAILTPAQFHIPFDKILSLPTIFFSNGEFIYYNQIVRSFSNATLNQSLLTFIYIPYFQLNGILLVIYVIVIKKHTPFFKKNSITVIFLIGSIFFGSIFFAFTLLCLYLFVFPNDEALRLASYNRYMNTYIFAIMVSIFLFFLENLRMNYKINVYIKTFIISLTITVALTIISPYVMISQFLLSDTIIGSPSNKLIAQSLTKNTPYGSSIFIINQSHNEQDNNWIAYYADGRKINRGIVSFSTSESNIPYDTKLTISQFRERIIKYDYLYCKHLDKGFIIAYGNLFENTTDLTDNTLFKVEKKFQQTVNLQRVKAPY